MSPCRKLEHPKELLALHLLVQSTHEGRLHVLAERLGVPIACGAILHVPRHVWPFAGNVDALEELHHVQQVRRHGHIGQRELRAEQILLFLQEIIQRLNSLVGLLQSCVVHLAVRGFQETDGIQRRVGPQDPRCDGGGVLGAVVVHRQRVEVLQDGARFEDQDVAVIREAWQLSEGMRILGQVAHHEVQTNLIGSPVAQRRSGSGMSVQGPRHVQLAGRWLVLDAQCTGIGGERRCGEALRRGGCDGKEPEHQHLLASNHILPWVGRRWMMLMDDVDG
mmetsp:Transcript_16590/g.45956  ORF Transcript_16590/g.45956 Transcript_16590/m.45956 type:complete len:278 (+) Transcript_16590:331-1164(+)